MAAESTDNGADKAAPASDQAVAPVVETYTPQTVATLTVDTPARPITADTTSIKVDAAPLFRTEANPAVVAGGDVQTTGTPKDRVPSKDAPPGSLMERLLKGDKDLVPGETSEVTKKFQDLISKYGMEKVPGTNETYAERILKGLKDRPGLQGTPEQQLARMTQALEAILNPEQAGADPKDADARLNDKDRANLVKDFVMRMADPEKYANQGAHNTCALTSMQKLALQGKDPARLAEQLAGVVNNGFTYVTNPETGQPQRVDVHSASLKPDQESSMDPTKTRGNQTRGMAGHAFDALFGQMVADNQGKVDSKKYVYLAANANDFTGGTKRSDTGEGFFEADASGNPKKFVDSSPQMTLVAKAQLSRMLDLPKGINFIHSSMVDEIPPGMRDQFTIFNDAADLKAKLADFNTRTGLKSAEVRVNAPFLPGERMAGHGLHSVNISLDNGQVRVDNHWGDGKDLTLSDAQIATATDKNKWNGGGEYPPSVYKPGQPQVPGNVIDGPTRLSTLPTVNETPDLYRQRMEQLKADQEAKVKELTKEKLAPTTTADRQRELSNELFNTEMMKSAFDRAFKQFQNELDQWSYKRSGSQPNLSSILNYEIGKVRLK